MTSLIVIPGTCCECSCTDDEPCVDEEGNTCFWVDPEHTICSECVSDEQLEELGAVFEGA